MQNNEILDNTYIIIKHIDQNFNGSIYLVRNQNNNKYYAAKIYNNLQLNLFQNEVHITTLASGLNHPNIIHFIQSGTGNITNGNNIQNNQHYLITDYYSNGDLLKYVMARRFGEKHAKYIFLKILKGVEALHGANICHRNLTLGNIYLDQDFNIKITNFSFATIVHGNNNLNDFLGSFKYISPQIANRQVYNGFKNDIFALGVILFYLVNGFFGFSEPNVNDPLYRDIIENNFDHYWGIIMQQNNIPLSETFKHLYFSMVSQDENARPTINAILNNNWFNEILNLNQQQLNQLENEIMNEFLNRKQIIQQHQQTQMNHIPEIQQNDR